MASRSAVKTRGGSLSSYSGANLYGKQKKKGGEDSTPFNFLIGCQGFNGIVGYIQ